VEAVAAISARRRFIEALAPLFGRPVEADSVCVLRVPFSLCVFSFFAFRMFPYPSINQVFCRKASVLSVSGVFTFLVISLILFSTTFAYVYYDLNLF